MGGGSGKKRRTSSGSSGGSGSGGGGIGSAEQETKRKEVQTKLTDYISQQGVDKIRSIVTVFDPTLGTIVKVAQFVYENREELAEAYTEISNTWSSDSSLEEKISETAYTVVGTTTTIVKKKGLSYVVSLAARELSDAAVETVDKTGVFDKIDTALKIPNAGDRFKDLLKNTIEKETENTLGKVVGA